MTVKTRPRIYYINPITESNNTISMREPNQPPALEITASLFVGSRTIEDLITEVERALNDSGANEYTVTIDRATRIVTISADDTFELLVSSGASIGTGVFGLIGFTGSDRTGASSYIGDNAIGFSYVPQFQLQSFKSFDDNVDGVQSSINESAAGVVEVVTFGDVRFMEFNLFGITNLFKTKGNPIENNPTGLEDTRALMEFLVKKSPVEFMIDKDNVASFDKILLESTRANRKGTGYRLEELISRDLNDHYETGVLKFRKVV